MTAKQNIIILFSDILSTIIDSYILKIYWNVFLVNLHLPPITMVSSAALIITASLLTHQTIFHQVSDWEAWKISISQHFARSILCAAYSIPLYFLM